MKMYIGILKVTPVKRLKYFVRRFLSAISGLIVVLSLGFVYCNWDIWFAKYCGKKGLFNEEIS